MSICDQCQGIHRIVSSREVCAVCRERDKRLDALQYELFEAVMAHEVSSVANRTWPRVSDAAHKLVEFYR